ncbi:MAG TPA: hypothetical protein VMW48_16020 [Vicinamibacterales bacterium]|nr:hypothetical protein [Vicinamibacterales bacterium]
MEQLLQNEKIMLALGVLLVVIVESLRRIIAAATNRAVAAIEGQARAGQAVSELDLRQRVADEVVAAVEQLAAGEDSGEKLEWALDLARERGVKLVRNEIEAALKRAEATWRMPMWVSDAAAADGMKLIGPEGND